MNFYQIKCLLFIAFVLFCGSCGAQIKFEKEVRVTQEQVPAKAVAFINKINKTKRLNWFLEQNINQQSFEAKFKKNNKKYSVEFDSVGNLQDIEVLTKQKRLGNRLQQSIHSALKAKYDAYQILKIQQQYTGKESDLLNFLLNQNHDNVTIKYEIEIDAKINHQYKKFECLFSDTGKLEQTQTIVEKYSDHLEF